MKVLITCPRAPVSIEWIRVFKKAGVEIILVDSLNHPISKYFEKSVYVKVASPKLDFYQYKEDMKKLISQVDFVIPNCEDIFYMGMIREELNSDVFFFMPEKELLFTLHNKFKFFTLLNNHVKFPKTKLISDQKEIMLGNDTILKPVFSRFGQNVIRDVNRKNINKLLITSSFPWVQQEKIIGDPICSYALICDGKVITQIAYRPRYLLNESAATYFEPHFDRRLDCFIKKFAKDSDYTGQIAFDFIDDGNDLYVIECNPRATSGLHLLAYGLEFNDNHFVFNHKKIDTNYRIGTTLYTFFGIRAILNKEFKKLHYDYKNSKDVLKGIPFYAQFFSLYEMIIRSIIYKKSLTQSSVFDIEFDG